jgi:hypothetical protein
MGTITYKFIDEEPKRKNKPGAGRPKKKPEERLRGRPQTYTEQLGNEICEWLSVGKSLTSYCKQDGNPSYPTIMRWLWKGSKWYRERFFKSYMEAREQQAQCLVDSIIDISDDGTNDFMELEDKNGKKFIKVDQEHIQRSRLRVEARKWIAAHLLPRVYGDSQQIKLTDDNGGPVTMNIIYESKQQPTGDSENR